MEGIALQSLALQQNLAITMLKQNAQAQQQAMATLMAAVSGRGGNVDLSV